MTSTFLIANESTMIKSQRRKKSRKTTSPNDFSVDVQLTPSQIHSVPFKEINKTTLERSIASISNLHENTNITPFAETESLKTETSSKRRSKKSTKNRINDLGDSEDPWIPVMSKKPIRDRIPSVHEVPEPVLSSHDTTEVSQKKKKKRKPANISIEKSSLEPVPSSQSTSLLNQKQLQSVESVVVPSALVQPLTKTINQPHRNSQIDLPEAELQHPQVNNNASPYLPLPAVAYTQELEFIISETLGSDVIVNARTHHSGVSHVTPPPVSSSARPLLFQNPQASEMIQLKSHLRAKEAECEVLINEVFRMHTNIIELKTAALSSFPGSLVDSSGHTASTVKRTKVKCISKETQCDVIPSEASGSRSSDIVISTLQEEIGRLAKENTILGQRNTNLENRMEVAKQRLVTTQANLQRSSAEALKAAQQAANKNMQHTTSALNQVQTELRDCKSQLEERDIKIQQLENSNHDFVQEMKNIQQEYEDLLASTASLQNDLAASNSQFAEFRLKLTEATLEKDSAVQKEKSISALLREMSEKCDGLETSLQTELQSSKVLMQRICELEVEVETSRRLGLELKENLNSSQKDSENAKRDLDGANNNLAHANKEVASMTSNLENLMHQLDESKRDLVVANEKIGELESTIAVKISTSSLLESTLSTVDNSCESCREMSANLEHYKEILCSTDSALTNLQKSVLEEEVKWQKSLEGYSTENLNLKRKLELMALEVAKTVSNNLLETGKQIVNDMPMNGYPANDVLKKTTVVDRRSPEFLPDEVDSC